MRYLRTGRAEQEGAVLLVVSIAMVTLLAIAALVLDLGAVRSNRAASRVAADLLRTDDMETWRRVPFPERALPAATFAM